MWNVTPTTNWIIVFGGGERGFTDTRVMELSKYMCTVVDTMCIEYEIVSVFMINKYLQNNWNLNTLCFVGQQKILMLFN